jgi:hypothetical protein
MNRMRYSAPTVAAGRRDRAARARDEAAILRDLVADEHDAAGEFHDSAADRGAAALDRQVSHANRHFAAVDRDDSAGDRALLREAAGTHKRLTWLVRVAFEDGQPRYYRRIDSKGPSDFTTVREDAQGYESQAAAFEVLDRLKLRYKRLRQIAVEQAQTDKP